MGAVFKLCERCGEPSLIRRGRCPDCRRLCCRACVRRSPRWQDGSKTYPCSDCRSKRKAKEARRIARRLKFAPRAAKTEET